MKFGWFSSKVSSDKGDYELLMEDGDGPHQNKLFKKPRRSVKPFIFLCIVVVGTVVYFFDDINSTGHRFYHKMIEASEKLEAHIMGKEESKWKPSRDIPEISLETIKEHINNVSLPECDPSLSKVTRVGSSHVLSLLDEDLVCCYSLITRKDVSSDAIHITQPDNVYTVGECISFTGNVTFSNEEQFVQIKCTKGDEAYSNMHAFVRKTKPIIKRIEEHKTEPRQPNVMLIGIESMSRHNLARTMPQTVEYLSNEGWIGFKGYNAIHNKAFSNLMAILTGKTVDQLKDTCWINPQDDLNKCSLLWDRFAQSGYVTAYAEDEPDAATFNQNKTGFIKTPVDYYLRPFMLAAEKEMTIKSAHGLNVCLGPTASADHILNYALDFSETFKNDSYFGLFWMNSFSHNNLNSPSSMDEEIQNFFNALENRGVLDTTVVIFLSDHGIRIGDIRDSYVGWLEERLPFMYIWVPEYYKNLNPELLKNLHVNSVDEFVSPFDVYETLTHLLGQVTKAEGCPKCNSLFEPIPWHRSCSDAGIDEHWCLYGAYKELTNDNEMIRSMVNFALNNVNKMTQNGAEHLNSGTQCASLKFDKILRIKKALDHEEYEITFKTNPGGGVFEATIAKGRTYKLLDTVTRINPYSSYSKCMNDVDLKKYCYCIAI